MCSIGIQKAALQYTLSQKSTLFCQWRTDAYINFIVYRVVYLETSSHFKFAFYTFIKNQAKKSQVQCKERISCFVVRVCIIQKNFNVITFFA